jgi:hypothetical protein
LQERELNALKVKMTRINNTNIIAAYGDCEFSSVQLIKDLMTEVIVDVRHLRCLDNSALVVILWVRQKMKEIGGKLVVVGLNCLRMKNAIGDLTNVATSVKEAMYSLNKESLGCM